MRESLSTNPLEKLQCVMASVKMSCRLIQRVGTFSRSKDAHNEISDFSESDCSETWILKIGWLAGKGQGVLLPHNLIRKNLVLPHFEFDSNQGSF